MQDRQERQPNSLLLCIKIKNDAKVNGYWNYIGWPANADYWQRQHLFEASQPATRARAASGNWCWTTFDQKASRWIDWSLPKYHRQPCPRREPYTPIHWKGSKIFTGWGIELSKGENAKKGGRITVKREKKKGVKRSFHTLPIILCTIQR